MYVICFPPQLLSCEGKKVRLSGFPLVKPKPGASVRSEIWEIQGDDTQITCDVNVVTLLAQRFLLVHQPTHLNVNIRFFFTWCLSKNCGCLIFCISSLKCCFLMFLVVLPALNEPPYIGYYLSFFCFVFLNLPTCPPN